MNRLPNQAHRDRRAMRMAALQASLRTLSFSLLLVPNLFAAAQGQTLDEQYEFYLYNFCQRMGFLYDNATGEVLPGQAGPQLAAYCKKPVGPPPDIPSTQSSGGGAGASASRGRTAGDPDRHRQGEDTQFNITSWFASVDYQSGQQDLTQYEDGNSADRMTVSLGMDRRTSATLLLGAALFGDELTGDYDGGGHFRSRGAGLTLFSSWLPLDGSFLDVSVGFALRQLDNQRLVARRAVPSNPSVPPPPYRPGTPADAEINNEESSADLLAGYDFTLGRLSLGPRVGGAFRYTSIDDYLESGATPMTLAFDSQVDESLCTLVGLQASAAFTWTSFVLTPQLNVQWNHEFRNDQRIVTARFAEDLRANPTQLRFLNQPPDRDSYTARLSVAAFFRNGLSGFVSAEKLLGHDYQDELSASLGIRLEL